MTIPSALLLLLGCPFIFGGPDLSNVKQRKVGDPTGETAADPTGDTGQTGTPASGATAATAATATTGNTGDTAPPGDAPVIEQVEVQITYKGVRLDVTASDVDSDLVGGALTVTDGKVVTRLLIPDDVSFDEKTGLVSANYRPDDFCDGIDRLFRVSVEDARGNVAADVPTSVRVWGVGRLVETGNYYPTIVGEIETPAVFCAEATADYDVDRTDFKVPVPAQYEITLGWDAKADLDMYIYDETYALLAGSAAFSDEPPEEISPLLNVDVTYQLDVAWYWGGATEWTVIIDLP